LNVVEASSAPFRSYAASLKLKVPTYVLSIVKTEIKSPEIGFIGEIQGVSNPSKLII